jgi:hypothetical protein
VLLVLGTNNSTNLTKHPKHTAENYAACCLCHTGQTDDTYW